MKNAKLIDNIVDHTDDSILVIDMNGVILSANLSLVQLLEISDDELIGQSFRAIFREKTENQRLYQLIADGLGKGVEHHLQELTLETLSGRRLAVQASTSLITDKDAIGKLVMKNSLVVFIKHSGAVVREGAADAELLRAQNEKLKRENRLLISSYKKFELFKILSAFLFFVLFFFAVFYTRSSVKVFPRPAAQVEGSQFEEQYAVAKKDTLTREIVLSGVIEPFSMITVAAQTSGKVVLRNFNEGDYVQKDQILYQMDTRDLAKTVRSAQVKYMELLDEYNTLKQWDSSLVVMQARRKYELSQIAMNNEGKKLQETKKLFEKGIIPRVEYEQAMTAYKRAEYDFENAKQALDAELEKGGEDKLQVLSLKLSNAKEELDEIEAQYEATLIRAPVSGIIMKPESSRGRQGRFVNEGDLLQEGDLVATIGATDSYIVNSSVGELNVNDLTIGDRVRISLPAESEFELYGRLEWIASSTRIEDNRRFFPVRISLTRVPDAQRQFIRLGMRVLASIELDRLEDVVTVPIAAVSYRDGDNIVYVITDEGIEVRSVTTGYSDRLRIVVYRGLEPGETVVYHPLRSYSTTGGAENIIDGLF